LCKPSKKSFSKIKVKGFEFLAIGKHWRRTLLLGTHFSSHECEKSHNNCFLNIKRKVAKSAIKKALVE
jgi:hypothetical protein